MARYRARPRTGVHLVIDEWGDKLHSDQVTVGLYGAQKGQVVAIDQLRGPTQEDVRRMNPLPPERPRSPGPWTGPDRDAVVDEVSPPAVTGTF